MGDAAAERGMIRHWWFWVQVVAGLTCLVLVVLGWFALITGGPSWITTVPQAITGLFILPFAAAVFAVNAFQLSRREPLQVARRELVYGLVLIGLLAVMLALGLHEEAGWAGPFIWPVIVGAGVLSVFVTVRGNRPPRAISSTPIRT